MMEKNEIHENFFYRQFRGKHTVWRMDGWSDSQQRRGKNFHFHQLGRRFFHNLQRYFRMCAILVKYQKNSTCGKNLLPQLAFFPRNSRWMMRSIRLNQTESMNESVRPKWCAKSVSCGMGDAENTFQGTWITEKMP
jgi:hypothetical protein